MPRNIHDYDDIIYLPHPVSKTHPPMSLRDRAGQFAPFSALTGLHAAADRVAEETAAVYESGSSPSLDKPNKAR